MKNKEINKFLRREGAKLPPEMYVAYPKELEKVSIDEDGKVKEIEQWVKVPTEYPVNHGRRLWRIWKRTHSIFELQKYFAERGFSLMYK